MRWQTTHNCAEEGGGRGSDVFFNFCAKQTPSCVHPPLLGPLTLHQSMSHHATFYPPLGVDEAPRLVEHPSTVVESVENRAGVLGLLCHERALTREKGRWLL